MDTQDLHRAPESPPSPRDSDFKTLTASALQAFAQAAVMSGYVPPAADAFGHGRERWGHSR